MLKKIFLQISTFLFFFLSIGQKAGAIPPPDFLFNVGSQIIQAFSFLAVALSILFGATFRFFKTYFLASKYKVVFWMILIVSILAISIAGAYFYDQYQQQQAYEKWIQESKNGRID